MHASSAMRVEISALRQGKNISRSDVSWPMHVRFLCLRPSASFPVGPDGYLEILYIESGAAAVRLPDSAVLAGRGDLLVAGSNSHSYLAEYRTAELRAVALYFHPTIILGENGTDDGAEYLIPFATRDTCHPRLIPAATGVPAQVADFLHRIHQESCRCTPHSHLAMKTYLKMILILLTKYCTSSESIPVADGRKNRNLERLQPLFDYVDQHYVESISVEDAATLLRMSKSHFMRLFRAVTGQAFISHLNRLRIMRAQQLIATTDRTIAAISQEVGFCDQSYFGVIFRRVVGMTPRDYRDACLMQRLSTSHAEGQSQLTCAAQ